jgi:hypothetical protein
MPSNLKVFLRATASPAERRPGSYLSHVGEAVSSGRRGIQAKALISPQATRKRLQLPQILGQPRARARDGSLTANLRVRSGGGGLIQSESRNTKPSDKSLAANVIAMSDLVLRGLSVGFCTPPLNRKERPMNQHVKKPTPKNYSRSELEAMLKSAKAKEAKERVKLGPERVKARRLLEDFCERKISRDGLPEEGWNCKLADLFTAIAYKMPSIVNPDNPSEIYSGTGKRPPWLKDNPTLMAKWKAAKAKAKAEAEAELSDEDTEEDDEDMGEDA